ncbi:MAG: HDOD domain-containing protein, partial [Candidatus Coatesbacteria bacterium]|nr:HDOD domain-containing protein [Candidatus Coatesbacteria bacterium]
MLELDVAKKQMAAERKRLEEVELLKALEEPKELPALPSIAAQVMRITSDPKASLPDLRKVVEMDEALTSKILRFSNSALYGRIASISTLTAAISALGFLTVRWLAVTASAHTLFRGTSQQTCDHLALWKHACRCAIGSQLLAKRLAHGMA